ncbi:hypothetical protein C0991_007285 [Blastosporella zonata]|nr:hypothetical protein C0991_007285 [Blastosporella zonata]
MGSGPSNARPAKALKTGSGQPSTKQAKVPIDISGAHMTDKDSVDEGLEGDIAVRARWSMRALVQLAPHGERVEFRETEGPCQQCTTAKVAERCWYPQAQLPCWRCLNSGIACKNSAGDTARDAQRGSNTTPAVLPTVGAVDEEEDVSGTGILGEPELEEEDIGAPVAPDWSPFEQVTRRVGELKELEAGMADYAATCKRESAALRFELLRLQTTLGETRRLQGALIEARREAEVALWEILAFE